MERGLAQPTVVIVPSGEPHSQLPAVSSMRLPLLGPRTRVGFWKFSLSDEDSGQNRKKTKLLMESEPSLTWGFVCHG